MACNGVTDSIRVPSPLESITANENTRASRGGDSRRQEHAMFGTAPAPEHSRWTELVALPTDRHRQKRKLRTTTETVEESSFTVAGNRRPSHRRRKNRRSWSDDRLRAGLAENRGSGDESGARLTGRTVARNVSRLGFCFPWTATPRSLSRGSGQSAAPSPINSQALPVEPATTPSACVQSGLFVISFAAGAVVSRMDFERFP